MDECTTEQRNETTNEWTNEWMNARMNTGCTNEQVNENMNEWTNESLKERIKKKPNEWTNEWINEWINKMNEKDSDKERDKKKTSTNPSLINSPVLNSFPAVVASYTEQRSYWHTELGKTICPNSIVHCENQVPLMVTQSKSIDSIHDVSCTTQCTTNLATHVFNPNSISKVQGQWRV